LFKTRKIKKQFDIVDRVGYSNLIVSGCSSTFNNHETSAASWPYYLRDIGGFDKVQDCSMPGAGNNHIANSLQWCIENESPDPKNSLVVVMWSGNDRDDYVMPSSNDNKKYPSHFNYSKDVVSGITGGSAKWCVGNLKEYRVPKSKESRAIENYLLVNSMYHYLKSKGFTFVFLKISNEMARMNHFDITPYLPKNIQQTYKRMFTNLTDLYEWAVRHDFLEEDDVHCNIHGHLDWTRKVLHPYLVDNYSI
tara:strand:- start:45 stop:794 length:750 start_codon:yes stop_codon:yes gene_type:complete